VIGFIPNLHIICPDKDGLKYIPQGKTMIRQLLGTGLYAASKTISPEDGMLVKAEVVGTQRFIRIINKVCTLFMDSGMVDFGNIGYLTPDFLGRDGTLIYGTSQSGVSNYLGDVKSNLSPPDKLSKAGDVTKAYKAALLTSGPNIGQRDNNSEQMLALKKICSVWVAPSTFTGKMRLYVQAQYGSLLDSFKFRPNAANAPPSLDYDDVDLTYQFHPNSTGIYLDSNCNHWLIQIGVNAAYIHAGAENVNITPLKASTCGEELRKKLRTKTPGTKEFDQLEAYILSTSYPVPFKRNWPYSAIVKPCVGVANRGSMGYGWKFNWSGNKADIISIDTNWDTGQARFKSFHHRVSISRAASALTPYTYNPELTAEENTVKEWDEEAARWSINFGTVETSGWWHNGKWFNVIAYPDFAEGNLAIFGTVLGGAYGDNVPIYCFYTRDDDSNPKVVRYSHTASTGISVQYMTASSPSYFFGTSDWGSDQGYFPCVPTTLGLEGGVSEGRIRNTSPTYTAFTVSNALGSTITGTDQSYTGVKYISGGKSESYVDWYGAGYWTGSEGAQIPVGDPTAPAQTSYSCNVTAPGGAYTNFVTWYNGYMVGSSSCLVSFTCTTASIAHQEGTTTLCVIPHGDAEAVYLWGKKYTAQQEVGSSGQITNISGYLFGSKNLTSGGEARHTQYNDFFGAGSAPYTDSTEVYTLLGAVCVSNAGVHTFDPTNYVASAFFAGEPNSSVGQQFQTTTSAVDKTLWGAGVSVPQGYSKQGHVFIGWA